VVGTRDTATGRRAVASGYGVVTDTHRLTQCKIQQEKVLHVDMGFFQNAMLGKKLHVDMAKSHKLHVDMEKSHSRSLSFDSLLLITVSVSSER